jgi:hypothetical protein
MGMRSPEGAAASRAAAAKPATSPAGAPQAAAARRPAMLTVAVGVLAAEAVGLAVAGVLSATDTVAGRSAQASNGIALTILDFILVAGLAGIALAVARLRPWTRTPAVMIQLFTGVIALYLLQAHRFDWGIPALLLAAAGLAGLLAPASLHALARPASRQ